MAHYIIAIDQGTTSSRAIIFDKKGSIIATGQKEHEQILPKAGWVEHDAVEIWRNVQEVIGLALSRADLTRHDIAAIGITNQRETTIVWDRKTGKPIHNAIVWQDRRCAGICERLIKQGFEKLVAKKTGLLLDPYFSGPKVKWLLDNVPGARARAKRGELAFGTVDSYLIWRLIGGKVHATDATNAARTMLYDIGTGQWDDALLALFNIPAAMLPDVRDCAADFGTTDPGLLGTAIPIRGVAGDQQAATVGQACFTPGMMKSTYGTGCFALLNTGSEKVASTNRLLTTIAYQLNGKPTYALEGSIFVAGAVVQWLRDGLKIIASASETQTLAEAADPGQQIYLVPAFTGLGAPYWDAESRGAIYGLTRATGPRELARAALESVAFQTRDLIEAMRADWQGGGETVLRVDGGMTASDWTMQAVADQLNAPVDRPMVTQTTALGAAYLAGLAVGACPHPLDFAKNWALDRRFEPRLDPARRAAAYDGWRDAVSRTLTLRK